jgi:glycosyltransferase involved in cell wall biosynthesis
MVSDVTDPPSAQSAMPRVLFVDQSGDLGGAELSLLDIARHFRAAATVALFGDGPFADRLLAEAVSVEIVGGRGRLGVRRDDGPLAWLSALGAVGPVVARLVALCRHHELVYANTQKAFALGALAARLSRRPLIWHLRDILTPEHFGRANLRLVVALSHLAAARVIANSDATAATFVAAGGDGRRLVTIPNGLDPAPWSLVPADQLARLRHELGLRPGPVVGIFGRLAAWKGQHVLLEALHALPDVQCVVVGDPLFGEEPYRRRLVGLVDELGLGDRVRLCGFRADVPVMMQVCEVIVHASTAAEPFGRVIVEAMLAGRPVIASDAGGAREIVVDGASGILVPPGDVGRLAAAIGLVLADHELAGRLAAGGRARALARFGLSHTLGRIELVVSEVAAAAAGARAFRRPRGADHLGSGRSTADPPNLY